MWNYKYTIFNLILSFILIVLVFIIIIFFTVFERKLLASIQRRRGPHYAGFWGMLQGIADGIKLIASEILVPRGANKSLFVLSPLLLFIISLSVWSVLPLSADFFITDFNYSFLWYFCISSLNSIFLLLAGFSSNSRYAVLGSVRVAAQFISYEIPFLLSALGLLLVKNSFKLSTMAYSFNIAFFISIPLFVIAFVSMLAETNRIPFDLAEAESELVAGYNVEYSSILFSFFFLAEYSNILTSSFFISFLFIGSVSPFVNILFALTVAMLVVVVRGILPRYRYTDLLSISWNILLVLAFSYFTFMTVLVTLANVSDATQSVLQGLIPRFDESLFGGPMIHSCINDLYNLAIFIVTSFLFCLLLIFISYKLATRKWYNQKLAPYECGYESVGRYQTANTTINFCLVAIIFLLFDIEVVYLYLWVVNLSAISITGCIGVIGFLVLLTLGFVIEALDNAFVFSKKQVASFKKKN